MFTPEALQIAAVAARWFPSGYDRTQYYLGSPCPARAMANKGYGYRFQEMCELLWNAAGRPSHPTTVTWTRESTPLYRGEHGAAIYWFQNELHRDPTFIAGILDSILVCWDPTWSSIPVVEPAPVAQMERAVVS